MTALKIVYKDPGQLKPRAKNPRTHTRRQIRQIAASITEFGFINPILIDKADGIIAGHGRAEAAKLLGMSDVPTVQVDHLTPAQIRAYVIADNRLAENAGWDRALLALELQELSVHLDFEPSKMGSVSTSLRSFTICRVRSLYVLKCGLCRCDSYADASL